MIENFLKTLAEGPTQEEIYEIETQKASGTIDESINQDIQLLSFQNHKSGEGTRRQSTKEFHSEIQDQDENKHEMKVNSDA